jgi:hypothetical protein
MSEMMSQEASTCGAQQRRWTNQRDFDVKGLLAESIMTGSVTDNMSTKGKVLCGRNDHLAMALCLAGLSSLITTQCFAQAIGAPEADGHLGFAVSLSDINIDDPSGPTDSDTEIQALNVIHTMSVRPEYRYWSEVFYHSYGLDGSASNIGQDVKRLGLRASLQREMDIDAPPRVWLGVGAQLTREEYTKRHTKDSQGFLQQIFPDRNDDNLSIVLEAVSQWTVTPRWDLGGKFTYAVPLGDGISEVALSAVFLYRY